MFENNKIEIGTVLGFQVQIHYSWFLMVLVLTIGIGTGLVGSQIEGKSSLFYWVAGLGETLVLYLCLLAHELGHSVAGRKMGLPIHKITLFLLGGVAQFRAGSRTPKEEFLLTVAGPAVSVGCGLLFIGAAQTGFWLGWETFGILALLQGGLNLMIAAFNLLPIFPLDGGRIFRGIIWWARDDKLGATRWATGLSTLIGMIAIGWGGWHAWSTGTLMNGLWEAMLGGFVIMASQREYAMGKLEKKLSAFPIREAMDTQISVLEPSQLLLEGMTLQERGPWLVARQNQIEGVISLEKLQEQVEDVGDLQAVRAGELASPVWRDEMFEPERNAEEVFWYMQARDQQWALIGRDGHLEGIVGQNQLIEHAWPQRQQENLFF